VLQRVGADDGIARSLILWRVCSAHA